MPVDYIALRKRLKTNKLLAEQIGCGRHLIEKLFKYGQIKKTSELNILCSAIPLLEDLTKAMYERVGEIKDSMITIDTRGAEKFEKECACFRRKYKLGEFKE